jgi:hypothetical protein
MITGKPWNTANMFPELRKVVQEAAGFAGNIAQ